MRIDFTPSEIALLKSCVRIASEDGSIYPTGDKAGTERIGKLVDSIIEKLKAAKQA